MCLRNAGLTGRCGGLVKTLSSSEGVGEEESGDGGGGNESDASGMGCGGSEMCE